MSREAKNPFFLQPLGVAGNPRTLTQPPVEPTLSRVEMEPEVGRAVSSRGADF